MEHGTLRQAPARSAEAPARNMAIAGPRTSALAGVAATLNTAPRVRQLMAMSGVVQRVINPVPGGLAAARQRLVDQGVPGDVVDRYQALATSYTEREIVLAHKGAQSQKPKQSSFPKLVRTGGAQPVPETSLIYRGMSINNVKNLKDSAEAQDATQVIFNAQNPQGGATAVQHIAHDDPNSPYLSFETGSYDISAGKYAPKPIGPGHAKPRGVKRLEGGFLKQVKSYTGKTKTKYATSSRVGYFGGLDPQGLQTLDVSTKGRAAQHLNDVNLQDRDKARKLAVNDREILVTPGLQGVPRSQVPFVGKVQKVTPEYYAQKRRLQTPTKALGYFKNKGAPIDQAEYYKVQIPDKYALPGQGYAFDIPQHHLRQDEDEGEISDVESVDLDLDDDDFSDQEEVGQQDALDAPEIVAQQEIGEQLGGPPEQQVVEQQPLVVEQQGGALPGQLLDEHL